MVKPIGVIENENQLIQECINFNQTAQNKLYHKFSSKMFAVCLRYSKNREEAEDILQEGFMKIFTNLKSFRGDGSLEGWMRCIIYHTAIQKFRSQKKIDQEYKFDISKIELEQHGSNEIISNIDAKELLKIIQTLPPRYKLVFNLYVFEGLKHHEIAKELGVTEGTSKSNLSDARKFLQKEINKRLQ